MKKKHNYPSNRKSRDTSYASCTQLVRKHGLRRIKKIWTDYGMYKTGRKLNASPYVIRHIVHKNNWKRPASKAPAILKGVQRGKMPASHYKSLSFTGITLNTKKRSTNV